MPTVRTQMVALAYIGDGYLAAACFATQLPSDEFWPEEVSGSDGFETVLERLPSDIAAAVVKQGCSDQVFSDGYEAANAVATYLAQRPPSGDGGVDSEPAL